MCCTPTERLLIVLTLPLAVVVLSIGYRPLGSCPRTAGWSAATLCVGPKRRLRDVRYTAAVRGRADIRRTGRKRPSWTQRRLLSASDPPVYVIFFALNEYDRGMRGYPSGRRHSLSEAGTRSGRPRQGKTSCSRNIVIVSPASIKPPRTAESE